MSVLRLMQMWGAATPREQQECLEVLEELDANIVQLRKAFEKLHDSNQLMNKKEQSA